MRRLPVPLALILSAVPLAGEPAITITETQVEVAALAPGTDAAVFGVSRFSAGFTAATAELASLESDLDEDGLVTWSPGQPIGAISFWGAADLSSGEGSVAWPEDLDLVEIVLDLSTALATGPSGPASRLDVPLAGLTLFIVRPGVGLWQLAAQDGGPADLGDPWDDVLSIDLAAADPIGATAVAYSEALPGDLLVGCSLNELSYFVAEVGS